MILKQDPFLSGMLGKPALRISAAAAHVRDARDLPGFSEPAFVHGKTDTNDLEAVHLLEKSGFHLIDTNVRLLFKKQLRPSTPRDCAIRFAQNGDKDAVSALAKRSFRQDRFHQDPLIPDKTADRIKQQWAGNFFEGLRGDWMVVATVNDTVTGFLQIVADQRDDLIIDLIAVDERARGRGIGGALIDFARMNIGGNGKVSAGTQMINTGSLRFYQNLGFEIRSSSYTFHLHAG